MIILSEAGASQTAPVAKNPLGTSEEPETGEGLIPGVRQVPWMRKSQPAPVFFLENSIDRGVWRELQSMRLQRIKHN